MSAALGGNNLRATASENSIGTGTALMQVAGTTALALLRASWTREKFNIEGLHENASCIKHRADETPMAGPVSAGKPSLSR